MIADQPSHTTLVPPQGTRRSKRESKLPTKLTGYKVIKVQKKTIKGTRKQLWHPQAAPTKREDESNRDSELSHDIRLENLSKEEKSISDSSHISSEASQGKRKRNTKSHVRGGEPQDHHQAKLNDDERWLIKFAELNAFKRKYNHSNVPFKYAANLQLGDWVRHQRLQYQLLQSGKTSSLTPQRLEYLEDVDFRWTN